MFAHLACLVRNSIGTKQLSLSADKSSLWSSAQPNPMSAEANPTQSAESSDSLQFDRAEFNQGS
ncbi:MAG: hypothetical protein ACXW32_01450, partial [Limisphaerales bacterium]